MKSVLPCFLTMLLGTSLASAQPAASAPADAATRKASAPAGGRAGGAARPAAPQRDPLSPGYVKATELPDGDVPPMEADGNFIIGPTHKPAPEMSPLADESMRGKVYEFVLESTESKFYPGIARDEPAPGAPRGPGCAARRSPARA